MNKKDLKVTMLHTLVAFEESVTRNEAETIVDHAIRLAILCKDDDNRGGLTGIDAISGGPDERREIERRSGFYLRGEPFGHWQWVDRFWQLMELGPDLNGRI